MKSPKSEDQFKRNAYDLNYVAKNFNKVASKKIIVLRGNDPYNAGGTIKSVQNESKESK